MIRLVTVTGSRTTTLPYMIQHYIDIVDEIHIVAYDTKNKQYENVQKVCKQFGDKVILHKHSDEQEYNWETVTMLYNSIKALYPNVWWIISDEDEFHVYSKPVNEIIADCHQCGHKCDTHINCENEACHLLFIQCEKCAKKYNNCCSEECYNIISLSIEDQKKLRKGKKNSNQIFKKGRSEVLKFKKTSS